MTVLALMGGPLDGVYLPANPDMDTLPTQVYVYSPECRGWSLYMSEEYSDEDDPPAKPTTDVYCLRRGAVNMMTSAPREADRYDLVFVRPLTPQEVVHIEKLGKRHGM